jgi:hypothetical protein
MVWRISGRLDQSGETEKDGGDHLAAVFESNKPVVVQAINDSEFIV